MDRSGTVHRLILQGEPTVILVLRGRGGGGISLSKDLNKNKIKRRGSGTCPGTGSPNRVIRKALESEVIRLNKNKKLEFSFRC